MIDNNKVFRIFAAEKPRRPMKRMIDITSRFLRAASAKAVLAAVVLGCSITHQVLYNQQFTEF